MTIMTSEEASPGSFDDQRCRLVRTFPETRAQIARMPWLMCVGAVPCSQAEFEFPPLEFDPKRKGSADVTARSAQPSCVWGGPCSSERSSGGGVLHSVRFGRCGERGRREHLFGRASLFCVVFRCRAGQNSDRFES